MTVDPRFISTFLEWADYSYPDLEEYGAISKFMPTDNWQDWSAGLLSLNGIAAVGAPDPYQFTDWREWAMRFNQTLGQGT